MCHFQLYTGARHLHTFVHQSIALLKNGQCFWFKINSLYMMVMVTVMVMVMVMVMLKVMVMAMVMVITMMIQSALAAESFRRSSFSLRGRSFWSPDIQLECFLGNSENFSNPLHFLRIFSHPLNFPWKFSHPLAFFSYPLLAPKTIAPLIFT